MYGVCVCVCLLRKCHRLLSFGSTGSSGSGSGGVSTNAAATDIFLGVQQGATGAIAFGSQCKTGAPIANTYTCTCCVGLGRVVVWWACVVLADHDHLIVLCADMSLLTVVC